MPARQASQDLLAARASLGTQLVMHTFSRSQPMKKHVCHPCIVAAWLMLGQTVHAQAIDTTLDKYLVLQRPSQRFRTCAVSFAQNGASGNLVVSPPTQNHTR
jgi:hypothetical protein